jgi:D-alanyl-D-alanine carboxypeptidase (penicillin-binding protein 5/6)
MVAVLGLAVVSGVAATRPMGAGADDGVGQGGKVVVTLPLPETGPRPIPETALTAADMAAPSADVAAAPIAMLYDVNAGQTLYARGIDQRFLPASVTKVMTLYVAFDLMAQGRLSPDRLLTVSDSAWKEWHSKGSRMFLERSSQVPVDALLMGIANVSANDGCVVLAEGVAGSVDNWVAMMNAQARMLGMTGSHFGTPNGWMDEGKTYYTARDLTRLAQAMVTRFPQYYKRYIGHPGMTWNGITQPNHDPTLGIVPGADGIKTGFTNEAGYNFLGSAERDGRRLIMVIAHMPNPKERARASRALLEWGFGQWQAHRLYPAGRILADAAVQQGTQGSVGLETAHAVDVTAPRGVRPQVSLRIRYQGPLDAPIAKGEEVARLEVRVAGQPAAEVPLVASADVPRGNGVTDRLRDGFAGLWQ